MNLTRLICLLPMVAGIILVGCNSQEMERLDTEIQQLNDEVSVLRQKAEELREKKDALESIVGKSGDSKDKAEGVQSELEEISGYESTLQSAVESLDSQLDAWKSSTRNSLVGKVLGDVSLSDGRTFSGAKVKMVSDDTVTIMHSGGVDEVQLTDLSEEIRMALIHEPTVLFSTKIEQ